jgi:hypothetical protein
MQPGSLHRLRGSAVATPLQGNGGNQGEAWQQMGERLKQDALRASSWNELERQMTDQNVEQQVVGDVENAHRHPEVVHMHDHYHVSHLHKHGLGEFEHQAHYHQHEHSHAALVHAHDDRGASEELDNHTAVAHTHDHASPSGMAL